MTKINLRKADYIMEQDIPKKIVLNCIVKMITRTNDNEEIMIGDIGRIVHISASYVGIEFERDIGGHECGKKCKNSHGWYVRKKNFKIIGYKNEQ